MNPPQAASPVSTSRPRKPLRRRWWFRIGLMVVLVYVGWCVALLVMQRQLIFPGAYNRHKAAISGPDEPIIEIEGVSVWFGGPRLDTDQAERQQAVGGVILFHGNDDTSSNAVRRYTEAVMLAREGWAVLVPEYPGFAGRPGTPSQKQIAQEGAMVARWMRERLGAGKPIVYVGYSLGGGVACAVASLEAPSGLLLRNTFTSIADFSWKFGVPPIMVLDPFDNAAYLRTAKMPVFLAHGVQDTIVPVAHARALAAITPTVSYVELDGDHFSFKNKGEYPRAVAKWFATNFPQPE